MDLARQINEYAARVHDLRSRQKLLQDGAGFFDDLYEEVSQGIEELRIVEEELRDRDREIYQAYAAVVQERRRYKELFALGPDAHLITDDHGVVLEVNVRAEELLGYPAEHLRGKPMVTFVAGNGPRKLFRNWFADALSTDAAGAVAVTLQSQHREAFAAELRVTRVSGETPGAIQLLWTIVDESQRLAARRDAELAAVVRVSGDAILLASMEGVVTQQNPTSRRLYGDLGGRPLEEVVSVERQDDHRRTFAGLSRSVPVATIDSVHVAQSGERFDVSATYSLIDEPAGSALRVAVVIRDVTAQKQLESQLRQRAVEREESDRKKTEFIGLLAHELRNPLNVIVTAMQALSRIEDPQAREQIPVTCLRNARHMTRLIDELLDLSRISRDELQVTPRSVALRDVVARAIELAGPTLEGRRHILQVELFEQALTIRVDPTRLTQAICNLLDNAAKYTPPGGRIWVTVHTDDRGVHIRVRDDGAGIPADLIGQVFEPFVQGRTQRSAGGGLGIGLALVRRIAELHGGSVSVESGGTGLGAVFTISLPPSARVDAASLELDSLPDADAVDG